MPDERYRLFGRFVSRETAEEAGYVGVFRELYERGKRIRSEAGAPVERPPEEYEPEPIPTTATNWHDTWSEYAITRYADGEELSEDALDDFPEDIEEFQIRYLVDGDPRYPRGWATGPVLGPESDIRAELARARRVFGSDRIGSIVFKV